MKYLFNWLGFNKEVERIDVKELRLNKIEVIKDIIVRFEDQEFNKNHIIMVLRNEGNFQAFKNIKTGVYYLLEKLCDEGFITRIGLSPDHLCNTYKANYSIS